MIALAIYLSYRHYVKARSLLQAWADANNFKILHASRSLFQLASSADRVMEVEDLIGGARFSVLERRNMAGIAAGDVFEARVIWDVDRPVFGRTFLFHPPDARDVVIEWVERVVGEGQAREEILFHLSRLYVRWHRLGHIGAAKVYRDAG